MPRAQRAEPIESETFTRLFPIFSGELAEAFARHASRRVVAKGSVVYEQGFPCESVPFLVSGVIRVYKIGESGREVTLFRVYPGQTCILSTSCGVSGATYPAIAEAEEDLELYTVPALLFREWVLRYPALHQFMCALLSSRLAETMLIVEEVAFRRVDMRLAEWLLRASEPPRPSALEATHAQIAVELGSAREVISRILKDFERHGYLSLGRGRIEVTSRQGLQDYRNSLAEPRGAEGAA
jgi:CRP/FNR family transcriptional regulator